MWARTGLSQKDLVYIIDEIAKQIELQQKERDKENQNIIKQRIEEFESNLKETARAIIKEELKNGRIS